ncbi:hypothetical protein L9F63_025460, partial [Diploptera punctata]
LLRKEPTKGRQLFPGGPKSKCGKQDGYFQEEFQRIFEKEAYTNIFKIMMKLEKESAKKNISKSAFVVPGIKKHSCPGDYYGTFSGKVEAFSPELKKKRPYEKQKPNVLVNPGKKGGPGYVKITISEYPEHGEDYYDAGRVELLKAYANYKKTFKNGPFYSAHYTKSYFDPNPFYEETQGKTYIPPKEKIYFKDKGTKWYPPALPKKIGGCKSGCFENWPEHSADKYRPKPKDKEAKKGPKKIFYPQAWSRTMQTTSTVHNKIDIAVNAKNWRNFQPITFPNK